MKLLKYIVSQFKMQTEDILLCFRYQLLETLSRKPRGLLVQFFLLRRASSYYPPQHPADLE